MTPGSASPLLLDAAAGAYQISRSVRFRASASAYFSRTPASTGNRQIYTYSVWVKRGLLTAGTYYQLFGAGIGSGGNDGIFFDTTAGALYFTQDTGTNNLITSSLYRDPSAWYHIVYAIDTTQATASNRVKVYVNGVQVTSFSLAQYPTLNANATYINTTNQHRICAHTNAGFYFDGYMTEINFIDGQALTPTSFGQFNATTGVWQPIRYGGSYGTNGFYLNFSDNSAATAAAIGKDGSGNGNNFTPNNISLTAGATYDSMIDVPNNYDDTTVYGRGNYCVLNPLFTPTGTPATLSNGNLDYSKTVSGTYGLSRGTIAVSSGKFYWEITINSKDTRLSAIGVENVDNGNTSDAYFKATSYAYISSGQKGNNNTGATYGASWTTGDILAVALNMDAGTVTFYKNNVSQGTAFTGLTGSLLPTISTEEGLATLSASFNFGQRPFAYTPPSDFKALNTQNLPTPTIVKSNTWFDVVPYTGNDPGTNTVAQTITGLNFKPDLLWIKARNYTPSHAVFDIGRGAGIKLQTDNTSVEQTSGFDTTQSFNTNGFTTGKADDTNKGPSGWTFVAWNWKKGATPGFDIVTYAGPASAVPQTVAHNLGVKPDFMIVKARNLAARNWAVYHKSLGATQGLRLNLTNAAAAVANYWNNTEPTSTVFTVGTDNDVNANSGAYIYVAYLFAEVAGFSKFGSYTGNGSADGPFVYCGFRPRWVLIRASNLGSAENWYIHDTARSTYNVSDLGLFPNLTNAEGGTGVSLDILSNGFKPRSTATPLNSSGTTYIFAAFAENPFKYALAR